MAARKGTTPITLNIFKAVKILLNSGSTQKEVAAYMSISEASVQKINKAEDFDDYKRIVNAWQWAKKKAAQEKATEAPVTEAPVTQVVEHRQSITIQATHFMMEEMKKTNELLTLISNKLGFIVDDLYGTKKEG